MRYLAIPMKPLAQVIDMARRKHQRAHGPAAFERMAESAHEASNFLKALSHESRLLILCTLSDGEKSVTELERLLGERQSKISQQLARLRHDGLVIARRDGKAIYYSIENRDVRTILDTMYGIFCRPSPARR
jgi:DNA-binding transcriptional ArsR family regulator